MIRPLLLLLLTFSSLFCKAQTNKTADTILKILTYGLPEPNEDRVGRDVAQKYGFTFEAVAGCSVSKELKDSVARENKRVYQLLEKRLDSDWKKTFDKDVDSVLNLQSQVRELVKKEIKEGILYNYLINGDDRPCIFSLFCFGWGKNNGVSLFANYHFTVDLATNTVVRNCEEIKLDEDK